jgi:serine/threonine protein kinase
VIAPLLRILEKMHTLKLLHRDIKPENIFLTGLGKFKLVGAFGEGDRQQQGWAGGDCPTGSAGLFWRGSVGTLLCAGAGDGKHTAPGKPNQGSLISAPSNRGLFQAAECSTMSAGLQLPVPPPRAVAAAPCLVSLTALF